MKTIILKSIKFYQKILSFDTGIIRYFIAPLAPITGRVCGHSPTCSQYTYQMVEIYGVFKGLRLGIVRILGCNPWAKGDCSQ